MNPIKYNLHFRAIFWACIFMPLFSIAQSDATKVATAKYAIETAKDCKAAIQALSGVSAAGKNQPLYIYYAAKAYDCLGDNETALSFYNKYLVFVPDNAEITKRIAELSYAIQTQKERQQAKEEQDKRDKAREQREADQRESEQKKRQENGRMQAQFEAYRNNFTHSTGMWSYVDSSYKNRPFKNFVYLTYYMDFQGNPFIYIQYLTYDKHKKRYVKVSPGDPQQSPDHVIGDFDLCHDDNYGSFFCVDYGRFLFSSLLYDYYRSIFEVGQCNHKILVIDKTANSDRRYSKEFPGEGRIKFSEDGTQILIYAPKLISKDSDVGAVSKGCSFELVKDEYVLACIFNREPE